MDYLSFSKLTEKDFDEVVYQCGGERFTNDPKIKEKNCDYILDDTVIELKIVEEEPFEKQPKQDKLVELFGTEFKTIIINPLDLNREKKRQYYKVLGMPIKTHIKKASKQLKTSAAECGAVVKIAIIMNNGLTVTSPEEFEEIVTSRSKNDTHNIDIIIVCGMYYYSDKFDSYAIFEFKDIHLRGQKRDSIIKKLRESWFSKVNKYMASQIADINLKRTKEPIQDLFFEKGNIRYVKPTIQMGTPSDFYGNMDRPREDTTGMCSSPKVARLLPKFDEESYSFACSNIVDCDVLRNSLSEYLMWAETECNNNIDILLPIVQMPITEIELKRIHTPFTFQSITELLLPKFRESVLSLVQNSIPFPNVPISLNYILVQVNEIGIDKANDIAFISHNMDDAEPPIQDYVIKGERMKYEYAIMLGAAYCMSIGADFLYYYKDESLKWK